ncbi:hypothetical protein EV663_101529 [Rhodovulum bhavnagarense]|uniref:Uncharacterized protein n=1 Tax=Rhodovulum bhavnagarense TaxID=992286 RepID=A0A4R2RTM9_9RHOB|nr:hypothetical protein [Rhodovulum bhavnagarense]TCP63261.1 hypothetical protein EV663_101529 [Rhodovulum bhavnagarense]
MNNTTSIILLGSIALAFAIDYLFNGFSGSVFLARKLADLIEYMAFWR